MPLLIDEFRRYCGEAQLREAVLNEADTEAQLVLPLLHLLGWHENRPAGIRRQVSTDGLFADIHLVADGRPLCVIEVKHLGTKLFEPGRNPRDGVLSALTKAGRETYKQAIGYAVADGIPFAWITNGWEHLVFRVQQAGVPIESRIVFAASGVADLLTLFGDLERLTPDELSALHLVRQTPPPAIPAARPEDVAYGRLISCCTAASSQHLSWLADAPGDERQRPQLKYSRSTFIARERPNLAFDEFWRSEAPLLAFVGEAGMGKTSLLCDLVITLQQRVGEVPCLFRDAYHLGRGLRQAVSEVLSEFTSMPGPHDLEAAVRCVEERVLAHTPFRAVLAALQRGTPPSHAAGLRNLLSRVTLSGQDRGFDTLVAFLSWVRQRIEDEDIAARLELLAGMPRPPAQSRRAFFKPHAVSRYQEDLDKYVAPLLASASTGALDLWESARKRSDATHIDLLDAVALLHASAKEPEQYRREDGFLALQASATRAWLDPAAEMLTGATPEELLRTSAEVRRALVHLLSVTGVPKFLLVVDAINESPQPAELRTDLIDIATRFQGRLAKLVVSCRTPDLPFFDTTAFRSVRYMPDHPGTTLEMFAPTEFTAAWKLYQSVYGIRGTPGPSLAQLCRNPLILRILCESYEDAVVPEDDIRLIEIFDGYWERKVAGARDGMARAILLQKLADLAMNGGVEADGGQTNVVPLSSCETLLGHGKDLLHALISEGVVVFLSPTAEGQAGVRFMYESFHEYVLARNVRGDRPLLAEPSTVLHDVLARCAEQRLMRGTYTYLLLWLDQQGVDVFPWVRDYFKAGYYGEAIAATSKLRRALTVSAVVRWLRKQSLTTEQTFIVARALARHAESVDGGRFGTRLGDALRDPRRATLAMPLGLAAIEGESIRVDPEQAAYILGFDYLWGAATGTQPPLDDHEASAVAQSGRYRRLLETVECLTGRRPVDDLSWLRAERTPQSTLSDELLAAARALLGARVEREVHGRRAGAVREWMTQLTARDTTRTGFWHQAVRRIVSLRRFSRRRLGPSDVLMNKDAGLRRALAGGERAAILFMARVLRLCDDCTALARTIGDDSYARRLSAGIALALYDLARMLRGDDPENALLWVHDLRASSRRASAEFPFPESLKARDVRDHSQNVWRQVVAVAGYLVVDVIDTRSAPRDVVCRRT